MKKSEYSVVLEFKLACAQLRLEAINNAIDLLRRVRRLQERGVTVPEDVIADVNRYALDVLASK